METGTAANSRVADRQLARGRLQDQEAQGGRDEDQAQQLPLVVLPVNRVGEHLRAVLVRHGQPS